MFRVQFETVEMPQFMYNNSNPVLLLVYQFFFPPVVLYNLLYNNTRNYLMRDWAINTCDGNRFFLLAVVACPSMRSITLGHGPPIKFEDSPLSPIRGQSLLLALNNSLHFLLVNYPPMCHNWTAVHFYRIKRFFARIEHGTCQSFDQFDNCQIWPTIAVVVSIRISGVFLKCPRTTSQVFG